MANRLFWWCLMVIGMMTSLGYAAEVPKEDKTASAPVYDAATVGRLLGISYSEEEIKAFGPPPEPLPGYVTFFDPGLSILQLRDAVCGKGTVFYAQRWYFDKPFAKLGAKPCYRQIRMEAVKDSLRKTFAEQQKLLLPKEEVPKARQVVTGMVVHYVASGERLYPLDCVRCADTLSGGLRVFVGDFDAVGLDISNVWDDSLLPYIGLAASRKSPTPITK